MAGVAEDHDDGAVEVGEDDGGTGVPAPERDDCNAEPGVVGRGHAVDVDAAAHVVVLRRVEAGAARQHGG